MLYLLPKVIHLPSLVNRLCLFHFGPSSRLSEFTELHPKYWIWIIGKKLYFSNKVIRDISRLWKQHDHAPLTLHLTINCQCLTLRFNRLFVEWVSRFWKFLFTYYLVCEHLSTKYNVCYQYCLVFSKNRNARNNN